MESMMTLEEIGSMASVTRNNPETRALLTHGIRTPLANLIGMTSVLLSKDLTGAERNTVEMIQSSSVALITAVDELLNRALRLQ